eukprot:TRINITY_DN1878_c0_g2_i1.p1 TRINITY_DN1878_c0_g2~~TRINITY_DN1878_c0_g2_i1.p1  ORF type:complete len:166 (-),score=33.92 TRINITY_DN1878_c0_g2_i1:63-560(-)
MSAKLVKVGDKLPDVTLTTFVEGKPTPIHTGKIFAGKKAVLFAVPGAFTPTCSSAHLPGFVKALPQLKEKGIEVVAVTSVNDAFVMDAWARDQKAQGIEFLADGSNILAPQLALSLDLSEKGLGVRSKRYALVLDDGVIKYVGVDEGPLKDSSAEAVLEFLNSNK